MNVLDYTAEPMCGGGFEIWTPDLTGAYIGSGQSLREALIDASRNAKALSVELAKDEALIDASRNAKALSVELAKDAAKRSVAK